MLEQSFYHQFEAENAYELKIPKCATWSTAKQRILILLQTVDGRDLKAKAMLGDRNVKIAFTNALKFARSNVAKAYKDTVGQPAYIIAPFNQRKHLNLKGPARKQAEHEFAAHAHKLIKKVKPTHVFVSGDEAFHALWPSVENHQYKRGWVHELQSGDIKLKVVNSLDFSRLLEKGGQYANLLGFWCRHLAWLMLGQNPHSISGVKPEYRYVDTIEKFDRLMDRLEAEDIIAVDTETRDLSVLGNAIYTIQFALNSNPGVGYVVPIDHPLQECWTKDQRKYIKKRLRKFFGQVKKKKLKLLVGFNIMYDLRVIRRCLKLPIIMHNVWEITAGEHNLDENIVELANFGSKPGNLAAVLCSYCNDFYMTAEFSKADRATTGTTKPTDKGFLKYGSMDVVSLLFIRVQQLARASKLTIEGKNYKPYFERHMVKQMGDTAHVLSHLREDGSLVDAKYLRYLTSTDSPIRSEMKILNSAFRGFKEAVEANNRLLANAGFKAKGLFAKSKAVNWAMSLSKPAHLRTLFFDVMGMEPVNETKHGEKCVDKAFIAANKDKNQVVASYGDYTKLAKLLGTYAKGWLKKLRSNKDSIEDHHLRPDYSFFDVATGRLASKNPSLQTIPSRGKLAKIIKRMFVTSKGYLLIRFDYSAHEVRVWSYAGADKVLADIFRVGQKLRQAFIQDPSDENKAAIKLKGDIHILNVKRLLNKVVDKDHPLRDAIKMVIFGLLYGKSAETLGEDTKLGDKNALLEKIGNPDTPPADVKKAEKDLHALLAEDRTAYAQGLIDKIFSEFKGGGRWTNKMKKLVETDYYVYSPIGRVRHLYAAMTGDRAIVSQQVRRGSNAPIQGFASEIGVKAGRLIMTEYYSQLEDICEHLEIDYDPWQLRVLYNRMVHDANYYMVPYKLVLPFIHILQWAATYGVTDAYEKDFNVKFPIEPEIEIEVGARDDSTHKWDWSIPSIVDGLLKSIDHAAEMGVLEGTRDEVVMEVFQPWRDKKMRNWLQEHYPLLNVTNLDKQIVEGIRPIYLPKKKEIKPKCKEEVAT